MSLGFIKDILSPFLLWIYSMIAVFLSSIRIISHFLIIRWLVKDWRELPNEKLFFIRETIYAYVNVSNNTPSVQI